MTELREWLEEKGVTHVVAESTGVYWKPAVNVLSDGNCFQLILVNHHNARMLTGHKTDKKDSAWLCKLLRAGLIKGGFIPPENNGSQRVKNSSFIIARLTKVQK